MYRYPVLILAWVALAVAASAAAPGKPEQGDPDHTSRSRVISFTTDRATWSNLDVGGKGSIVFELLGDLYTLPPKGGKATLLRGGPSWDAMPKFSPDGRKIAFISDIDGGMRNLWVMDRRGGNVRQLSFSDRDILAFDWSGDGQALIASRFFSHKEPKNGLYRYTLEGEETEIGDPASEKLDVAVARDGTIYYTEVGDWNDQRSRRRSDIIVLDPKASPESPAITKLPQSFSPVLSPDGLSLAFARMVGSRTFLFIRDIRSGSERRLAADLYSNGGRQSYERSDRGSLPSFAFTPDGKYLLVPANGGIRKVDVATGKAAIIPFVANVELAVREPVRFEKSASGAGELRQVGRIDAFPGGKELLLAAAGKALVVDLVANRTRPLTKSEAREYEPVISPDGGKVALVEWGEHGSALVVVDRDGTNRRVIAQARLIAQPRWSPDGRSILYLQAEPQSCAGPLAVLQCKYATLLERTSVMIADFQTGETRQLMASMFAYPNAESLHSLRFSQDDKLVYFHQFGISERGGEPSSLSSLDLRTGDVEALISFTGEARYEVGQATPSSDGRYVAIVARDSVHILDRDKFRDKRLSDLSEVPGALFPIGPASGLVSWAGDGSLIWANGGQLLSWRPGMASAARLADLNLRVDPPAPPTPIAIVNARIITMSGKDVIEQGTLLVSGGRIEQVGPAAEVNIPAVTRIVDGSGMTIIPGIVDTHGHIRVRGERRWDYPPLQSRMALRFLSFGATTVYDPQAAPFQEAELIAAGRMIGPRIFAAGFAITGELTNRASWARSIADLDKVVDGLAAEGALMIKSYVIDRRDWRQALVSRAAERQVMVTTEGGSRYYHMLTHVADGHTAIEHNFPNVPLYEDVIQFVAKSGVFYTPTLVASVCSPVARTIFTARADHGSVPRFRRFSVPADWNRFKFDRDAPDGEHCVYAAAESARNVVRAGGKVTLGSHGEDPGLSVHWEMWLLQMGGFTPMEALRAATLAGAQKLGLESDLGSLETGKLADFVVLRCNPLENIRCSADIAYVAKGGLLYDAETMTQLHPQYEPLPASFWAVEPEMERPAAPLPEPLDRSPRGRSVH